MKPLSISAYFDGRLGHEKQTLGILDALAEMTPTEVMQQRVSVSASSFCKNWLSYLLSCLHQPKAGRFTGPVELIIGTGSHTHIPMLLEKKSFQKEQGSAPHLVTCMTPDTALLKSFDLCCVPMHDEPVQRDNILVTLGPPNTVKFSSAHLDDHGLILVGGLDRKSHTWSTDTVALQVRTVLDGHRDMQWTISSSPRTPEETCRMLEDMAETMQQVNFFRSADTPAGWVEKEYARNRLVWVTADSVSMVYEALTAGCMVGVLPVDWLQADNKFSKSLDMLAARKMIIDFNEWRTGKQIQMDFHEPLNESKRCALEIMSRWWPDRLQ